MFPACSIAALVGLSATVPVLLPDAMVATLEGFHADSKRRRPGRPALN
jgi:hypothetical protein